MWCVPFLISWPSHKKLWSSDMQSMDLYYRHCACQSSNSSLPRLVIFWGGTLFLLTFHGLYLYTMYAVSIWAIILYLSDTFLQGKLIHVNRWIPVHTAASMLFLFPLSLGGSDLFKVWQAARVVHVTLHGKGALPIPSLLCCHWVVPVVRLVLFFVVSVCLGETCFTWGDFVVFLLWGTPGLI